MQMVTENTQPIKATFGTPFQINIRMSKKKLARMYDSLCKSTHNILQSKLAIIKFDTATGIVFAIVSALENRNCTSESLKLDLT